MSDLVLDLPRWYHGPCGNNKRVEAETPPVSLTPEETAAWLDWARAEVERQREEEDAKNH